MYICEYVYSFRKETLSHNVQKDEKKGWIYNFFISTETINYNGISYPKEKKYRTINIQKLPIKIN
jgi:hypothetical protein